VTVALTPEELKLEWQTPGFTIEKELRPGRDIDEE